MRPDMDSRPEHHNTSSPAQAHHCRHDVDRVLVDRRRIARRVQELADDIRRCYDGELTILGVLTGSLVFLADLVRQLPMRLRIYTVAASSYAGNTTRPGELRTHLDETIELAGRDVLIVDDILDSGQTLAALTAAVRARNPQSVRVCVLLRKEPASPGRLEAEFVGFTVEPEFVVGYGLDYNDLYRNLPDVCTLRPEVFAHDEGATP